VTKRSLPRKADLDSLVTSMEVEVAALTECFVSPGWRLCFPAAKLPAIHYTLSGCGRMKAGGDSLFTLRPHTLVIMPPDRAFHIESHAADDATAALRSREASMLSLDLSDKVQTFRAGEGDPQVSVICGYFRASYGLSIDLFATFRGPIIEQFEDFDHLGYDLKTVLAELSARKAGMRAMTSAVLSRFW
jgi:hypothetical protein